MLTNTICAISTALSPCAISIVRMSGPDAVSIVKKIFVPHNEKSFNSLKSHTIHYGQIKDNYNEEKVLDKVLVSYMKAPNTYTGEDVIEINCHGGVYITKEVLNLLLKNGAHLAEPGEFTKRAFLNNKVDLTQAEAVMDLINSETKALADSSINQLNGSLSYYVNSIRKELLNILSTIAVNIDYPEYDEPEITVQDIKDKLVDLSNKISDILNTANTGKLIKEGIKTAIVGKPNVGKSSLLNKLLKEDRAIVTDIPGTTRDTVEEYISINGIPLKLVDTAGIRDAQDEVERIGINKSKSLINSSDLIIAMFDWSKELDDSDIEILSSLKDKKYIILINKLDLEQKINMDEMKKYINEENIIKLSIKSDDNINILEEKIKNFFFSDTLNISNELIITNERHKDLLYKASSFIEKAINEANQNVSQDLLSINLTSVLEELNIITGESVSDEIINSVFHKFCVGK